MLKSLPQVTRPVEFIRAREVAFTNVLVVLVAQAINRGVERTTLG